MNSERNNHEIAQVRSNVSGVLFDTSIRLFAGGVHRVGDTGDRKILYDVVVMICLS